MYCRYCGKGIDDDSVYCRFCGNKQIIENSIIEKNSPIEPLDWCSKRKWILIGYAIYFFFVLILVLDMRRGGLQAFFLWEILVPLILYVLVTIVKYFFKSRENDLHI